MECNTTDADFCCNSELRKDLCKTRGEDIVDLEERRGLPGSFQKPEGVFGSSPEADCD